MEICSQHSDCNQVTRSHGERLAKLEIRVEQVEGVQEDMVTKLEEAAKGLRALAGQIDSAVSVAKKEGCQEAKAVLDEQEKKSLSGAINAAWKHFQENFALFIVYSTAGGFVWFIWKSVTGDWKMDSNVIRMLNRFIGG